MSDQRSLSRGAILTCLMILVGTTCGFLASTAARAHEIRPAIITIKIAHSGRFDLTASLNAEALIARIGPKHKDTDQSPAKAQYNQLRLATPKQLEQRFRAFAPQWIAGITLNVGGRTLVPELIAIEVPPVGDPDLARLSIIRLKGQIPATARSLIWAYKSEFGSSVVRLLRPGDLEPQTSWLTGGKQSRPFPLHGKVEFSFPQTVFDYIVKGFTHIIPIGLDHILFVLGLYLLSAKIRPLLMQVTAFTLAHSITLALGLYGIVRLSPQIVEPLIAASIVYVGIENIMTSKLSPWRIVLVFGFGLLHGLGFAGLLQEIDPAQNDYVASLIGFNIGVEVAQLAVIAAAWLLTGYWFAQKEWYRARIVVPASLGIAIIGLYWTVARLL